MIFRVAGHLGRTEAELLAVLSERELAKWDVYERMFGPVGGVQLAKFLGQIAMQIVAMNGGHPDPSDYLPWLSDVDRPAQSAEEQARILDGAGKAKS